MEEEFSKLNQGVDGFKEQSWLYLIEPSKKEKKRATFQHHMQIFWCLQYCVSYKAEKLYTEQYF